MLNFVAGASTSNGALVGTSANGGVCLLSTRAADVTLDATSWFVH
jgi:hypothetical protein